MHVYIYIYMYTYMHTFILLIFSSVYMAHFSICMYGSFFRLYAWLIFRLYTWLIFRLYTWLIFFVCMWLTFPCVQGWAYCQVQPAHAYWGGAWRSLQLRWWALQEAQVNGRATATATCTDTVETDRLLPWMVGCMPYMHNWNVQCTCICTHIHCV